MNRRGSEKPTVEELRRRFRSHLAQNAGIAGIALTVSLAAGMAGYHWLAPMSWIDAFVNASMLLGGMGPVDDPKTDEGKLFAGFYALYAGLVFLVVAGVLLAPVVHRVLHRFHWEAGGRSKD